MYCIVYSSIATKLFDEVDLRKLLVRSRMHNHRRNISGVLLYADDGNIIQVLEGEQATVETVFAQIAQDYRHFNVVKMADGPVAARAFADWSMGFHAVSGAEFTRISGYLDLKAPDFLVSHTANCTKLPTVLQTLLHDFVAAMPQLPEHRPASTSRESPSAEHSPDLFCSDDKADVKKGNL